MVRQTLKSLRTAREFKEVYAFGFKNVTPGFICFSMVAPEGLDDFDIKVGIVASKKVGNAVARNRAKRRLREALRGSDDLLHPGWRYVFVARVHVLTSEFGNICKDMHKSLSKAHGQHKHGQQKQVRT